MLKLPDPVSTGSRPEALPVSLHISAEVSGSSMGETKFPRATLQGEAKKTPHLFFVLSLAGPDMQRARCTAFSFLSSLLISAENREGSSQRAVCFSLFFSPGIPLKREDRSLQGSPAKETFSLFTFRCFSLCSLFLVGLFSPRHKESSFGAFQCQIIQCKHSHLYYHQYSALQFQQQMNDTVHKKTNAANDWKARSLYLWKGISEMHIIRSMSVSCMDSMHHQSSVCIYSKEKRPEFSCWPVLCRFGAGLPAWYVFTLTKEVSMIKNRDWRLNIWN